MFSCKLLEFDIKKHKILFEDVKQPNQRQQIEFSGIPFIIIGKKALDCTHGTDHSISTKKKAEAKKTS